LPLAHGYVSLIRDLMLLDDSDEVLKSWQSLDHIIALSLLHISTPTLRSFSAKLAETVDAWGESQSKSHSASVPLLFKDWLRGQKEHSKALEVFGSLDIPLPKKGKQGEEWARKKGYQAVFVAAVLQARSQGISVSRVEKQFGIKNLDGVEERWRDDLLWLLAGISKLLDVRTFYFHLKEDCEANQERIKRVKVLLKRMQRQILTLMEQVKYCSALGPLLRDMQRANRGKAGVGIQTIRKLENGGIESIAQLAKLKLDEIVAMGIRRDIAERIVGYIRKRRV
jgi:helicase